MVLHGGLRVLSGSGGITEFLVNSETFERDATGTWHFVTDEGPSPRYGHAMAYDEALRRMVIVGGENFFSRSDVWEWRYVDPVNSGSCPAS
jgi:hypothetical protein